MTWRSDTRIGWAVFAVFAVASIVLLDHRSLWLDEIMTLDIAQPHAAFDYVLRERLRADRSPPLYFILVHFWMGAFGDGEIALRSLNLLGVGVLGLAMLYSRTLPSVQRAWLPFWVLLLTSRFAWDFVTEGRAYFLLFCGTALLSLLFVDLLQRIHDGAPVGRLLLAVTGLTALPLGVLHYFGFLFGECALAILFALALFKRRLREAAAFAATGAVMLAALAFWVLRTRPNRRFWLDFDPQGAVVDFVIYAFSSNVVLVFIAAFAVFATWRTLSKDVPLRGLAALLAMTFGIAFVISFQQPLLHMRYLIVLAPPLLLIVARVLVEAPQRWVLPASLASALLISLPVAVAKSLPSREDWRSAARYIEASFPTECRRAVMMAEPASWRYAAHRYYAGDRDWTYLPVEQGSVEAVLQSPCPVLVWAGHLEPAAFERRLAQIDWKGTATRLVRFEGGVYLLVRAGKQS